jgi:hypothetical protein
LFEHDVSRVVQNCQEAISRLGSVADEGSTGGRRGQQDNVSEA